MKIVKKIVIEKFRKMSKLEIPLDAHIVAIAGQNGTQKTSLLGMIAHPFSLKDKRDPMSKELDVYGCRFGSAIQDRFKFSSNYDKAGEHIWSIEIVPWMWSRSRVKCVSARRSDVNEGWRFSDPSKKKGAGYIQCPIIYLSLKRLIPIGELKKVKNPQLNLSLEEQRLFGRWHNEILISTEKVLGVRSVNGWAKKSAGITTGQYDALTMSAGQDNVGEIILAVLSMKRLKKKYFSKLSEDDIFWERGLRGYTKQKCFRDVNVDEKSKSKIKQWFSMQDDLRKNGRLLLVRRWLQDNPKVKEEFNRQFFKAYKKVMEVRGGY